MKTRKKDGNDGESEGGGDIAGASVVDDGDFIKVTIGGEDDEDAATAAASAEAAEAASNLPTQFILQTDDGTVVHDDQPSTSAEPAGVQPSSSSSTVAADFDTTILDNIWSAGNNALRDLLVFLVRKYHIDEVYDSKVKAANWDKLLNELMETSNHMVGIQKNQVIRKWHNWKQYNKQHGKPHPFVVAGDVTVEDIMDRVDKLIKKASVTPKLAKYLATGGNEATSGSKSQSNTSKSGKKGAEEDASMFDVRGRPASLERLKKIRDRDFKVRRTGVSALSLTLKKLEHEIALETLNYEQEKWRTKCANNKLIQQKLERESEIADMKLERAKTELAIKRHECATLGIPLPADTL